MTVTNQSKSSTPDSVIVDEATLASRIIDPADFVADRSAFVDIRLPRSAGKASYSFIGPGVSQNPNQTINIVEPHGFNVGAASMPHGVINNPHLHFTAEVFVCTAGRWRFDIGDRGQQTLEVGADSILSVPTWVFRGFENIGPDDGWLFVILGGDDTGGILWAPWVLEEAAETGLRLSTDYAVVDTSQGDSADAYVTPLGENELKQVDRYDDAALADQLVTADGLVWSERALLSGALPDHRCSMAPVIGHGMSEDRHHRAPITSRHGFSVEWLRIEPGSSTGLHRHDETQVLFMVDPGCQVRFNAGPDTISADPIAGSIVSVPAGSWRDVVNNGDEPMRVIVVNGGDGPNTLEWDRTLIDDAYNVGWSRDSNGYVAPATLLKPAL